MYRRVLRNTSSYGFAFWVNGLRENPVVSILPVDINITDSCVTERLSEIKGQYVSSVLLILYDRNVYMASPIEMIKK